ncbi:MAG: hypothetical protein B7Z13_11250 [Caulobacterales bacterium 32-67-6]|nr:MAG: hypothetical protein B7Z13_11250 [Caulobacterales bacterium 32-67-6]
MGAMSESPGMITATTPSLAERETAQTLGVVTGEAIIGAHIFRDFLRTGC